MKKIWLLMKKELLQAVRDRRTALLVIIFPLVFYPLVLGVIYTYTSQSMERGRARTSQVIYQGKELAPDLAAAFRSEGKVELLHYADRQRALQAFRKGNGDLLVLLQRGGESNLDIELKYKQWDMDSEIAVARARALMEAHFKERMKNKLTEMGVHSQELSAPFTLSAESLESERRGLGQEMIEQMLPYFVILAIITAAMGLGAEITAGEKEKKTLSTLLVSQLSRTQIVLGKFLAVFVVASFAALFAVIGLVYGLGLFGVQMDFGAAAQGPILIGILLTLFPLVAILSAIVIIVGSFARTQKEANIYQSPIYMLIILAGIVSMAGGLRLQGAGFFFPVVNSLEVFKELLRGGFDLASIGLTLLSNLVVGGMLLLVSIRLFQKESILFRN